MAWIYVLAGLLEIVWAFFMKKSGGFTLIAICVLAVTVRCRLAIGHYRTTAAVSRTGPAQQLGVG